MIRVVAAGGSDVGRVREVNEDAFTVGTTVFAVADGMGGHEAGEIASGLALEPVLGLDGRVFGDPEAARDAIVAAVEAANERIVAQATEDPALAGMGTTVTLFLLEGRRLHLGHVGDSRAYLLRDDELVRLTADHTFVQRLVDAGRITEDQAATHPQRSVVTRAVGVEPSVRVDVDSLDLQPEDRLLLCSDGLSGVVPRGTVLELLRRDDPPDEVVAALLRAADAAGAPDNVTAVVVDVQGDEIDRAEVPPSARRTVTIRPDHDAPPARPISLPGPDERGVVVDPRARRRRIAAGALAVVLVAAAVVGGGWWLLSRSWYVGVDDDRVAIYQGIPAEIGPLPLSWVAEETSLEVDRLPAYLRRSVEEGVAAVRRSDARRIVEGLREDSRAAADAEPAPDAPTDPSPGASPDASPTAAP